MVTDNMARFDMGRKPIAQRRYLQPISWLLAFPAVWKHRLKVRRHGMEGVKPPYLLLCTHHAFMDFKVTTAAIFPHRANYIVAIDGFLKGEWLLRNVGCVCKRRYTNDIGLIRQIRYCLDTLRTVVALYPEARYSQAGTTAALPESLGKMVRLLGHPVVVLNMHGNYLNSPVWQLSDRKVPLEADLSLVVTADEAATLPVAEINGRIAAAMAYDEYAWQEARGLRVDYPERARGLHQVLYKCPRCGAEHVMESAGAELSCGACGKRWRMDELGRLAALEGPTEFARVPNWYEWERESVRKELLEGRYRFEDRVVVDSLPNARGFVRLGEATLEHSAAGFRLHGVFGGEPFELAQKPKALYSLHVEYNYLERYGECIGLNTLTDTYYVFPQTRKNCVTKLYFATEELHKLDAAGALGTGAVPAGASRA